MEMWWMEIWSVGDPSSDSQLGWDAAAGATCHSLAIPHVGDTTRLLSRLGVAPVSEPLAGTGN